MTRWDEDPITRELTMVSYAERFRHQYMQFRAKAHQTKTGTPLDHTPFLTEARRAELRALNIYTVEALAAIDGNELKNLGPNGRSLKNQAMDYIEEARQQAPDLQLAAQLEAANARTAVLEEDIQRLKAAQAGDPSFSGMSNDQLREYITSQSGQAPLGSSSRKTLLRMAEECTTEPVA